MRLVFDSCALIAIIKNEPGGGLADSLLADPENTCVIHAVNLCEVYYEVARIGGQARAQDTVRGFLRSGLALREDVDVSFWQQAGDLKADLARISLADCFCVALANRLGAEIVTTDHAEFDQIAEGGLAQVRFLR